MLKQGGVIKADKSEQVNTLLHKRSAAVIMNSLRMEALVKMIKLLVMGEKR
jgi:hypothetical protein